MTVEVRIVLQEAEADALLRADEQGRAGWNSRPSLALQRADAKIIAAIRKDRDAVVKGARWVIDEDRSSDQSWYMKAVDRNGNTIGISGPWATKPLTGAPVRVELTD